MNTVTKLIPQIVDDFVFSHDTNGFLRYNKKANILLQVGDMIEEVELYMVTNNWGVTKKTTTIKNNIAYVFRNLINNETIIDFDFIIDEYITKRDKEIELDIIKRTKKYKEDYKKWWAHDMNNINIDGISSEIMSETDYVQMCLKGNSTPQAYIIYKGIKNQVSSNNYNYWKEGYKKRYTLRGSATKNKRRIYASLKNLSEKYIQLVEFKLASDKAAEIIKENIRLSEEAKYNHLKSKFGDMIIKEEKLRNRWGGYSYRSQTIKNHYIKINNKEYYITFITDEDGNHLYEFENLKELTDKQVKGIIKSLKIK